MRTLLLATALLAAALGCGRYNSGPPAHDGLLAVGELAPDVTLTGLDDQSFQLSSLRGKTVLLNFWFHT